MPDEVSIAKLESALLVGMNEWDIVVLMFGYRPRKPEDERWGYPGETAEPVPYELEDNGVTVVYKYELEAPNEELEIAKLEVTDVPIVLEVRLAVIFPYE